MNFSRILRFINNSQMNLPLGRWNIHNHKKTVLKIKYANEDNCGISGNISINTTNKQEKNLLEDGDYVYMLGYESVHN